MRIVLPEGFRQRLVSFVVRRLNEAHTQGYETGYKNAREDVKVEQEDDEFSQRLEATGMASKLASLERRLSAMEEHESGAGHEPIECGAVP